MTPPAQEREDNSSPIPSSPTELLRSGSRHVGLVIGGVTFVAVVFKILSVAQFDTNVAYGLLTASDTGRVLFAIVLSLAPTVIALVAGATWLLVLGAKTSEDRAWALVRSTLATFVALFIAPFTTIVVIVLVVAIELVFVRGLAHLLARRVKSVGEDSQIDAARPQTRSPDDRVVDAAGSLLMLGFALLLSVVVLPSEPWMPSEAITLDDGTVMTGYVVAVDGDWATVLTEPERALVVLKSALVSGREVCSVRERIELPLVVRSSPSPCPGSPEP